MACCMIKIFGTTICSELVSDQAKVFFFYREFLWIIYWKGFPLSKFSMVVFFLVLVWLSLFFDGGEFGLGMLRDV